MSRELMTTPVLTFLDLPKAEAQTIATIALALTIGRPVRDVRIRETCGRVALAACEPLGEADPVFPVVLVSLGSGWQELLRQWARHLLSLPGPYSYLSEASFYEEWLEEGRKILVDLSNYVTRQAVLTRQEREFLLVHLWLQLATGGERS